MMRKVIVAVAFLLVVAACGGGDDTATTAPATAAAGQTTSSSTAAPTGGNGAAPGADNPFCRTVVDMSDTQSGAFDLTPEGLEESMQKVLAQAKEAAAQAPGEIRAAVDTLIAGFEEFVAALAEFDYDLFSNAETFSDDPRVLRLESAEYLDAAAAIEEYCGIEPTASVANPPAPSPGVSIPGDGTAPPAGGTLPPSAVSGDLPDGFPEDLVPPGVTGTQVIDVGGVGYTVNFTSDASFDDTVAYYTTARGEPQSTISSGSTKSALWLPDEGVTTIVIQEFDGVVTINVSSGIGG